MKKIWIQLFIIIIGILLCIVAYKGVKKYFYNNYFQDTNYVLAYNNFSDVTFNFNVIEEEPEEILSIPKETTTSTTKKITTTQKNNTTTTTTTTIPTTTMITTTTASPIEIFENKVNETNAPTENTEIIYEGLTLEELTEKLNKNLKSTLTNTGHYFANYYLKTGLDPYLAVAIVLQETGCKWTCSKLVRNCNNIGGMKGSPKCNGGSYRKYDTLEEGINGYLDMLYKNYYSKGLTTPELINPKYASSTTWSVNVNSYIESIKAS